MSQTQTTPHGEVEDASMSEDQAAAELLKRWGTREDDAGHGVDDTDSTDSGDGGDENRDAQPDEGTSADGDDSHADEEDGNGDIEIDVNGEKFKLPPASKEIAERIQAKAKEVEAGATRKFQEAAELRKAVELTAAQAIQQQHFNQAQAQLLGDHQLVQREMQRIEQIDMTNVADGDLSRVTHRYNQLQAAKGRIEAAYQQAQGAFASDQAKVKQQRLQAAHEFAKQSVKDWASGGQKRLAEYAMTRGIAAEELEEFAVRNPRLLQVLDDAEFGSRIRGGKTPSEKRVSPTSKTVQPGVGGRPQSTAVTREKQAMDRLRKTGNVESAALALLARSKVKKR